MTTQVRLRAPLDPAIVGVRVGYAAAYVRRIDNMGDAASFRGVISDLGAGSISASHVWVHWDHRAGSPQLIAACHVAPLATVAFCDPHAKAYRWPRKALHNVEADR